MRPRRLQAQWRHQIPTAIAYVYTAAADAPAAHELWPVDITHSREGHARRRFDFEVGTGESPHESRAAGGQMQPDS